ncbi:hypothetical protein LWM68_09900 [Niabella sp. W65]|nr:hypothetical protein [Niabella sp. W65]MCH7363054.1 hypothetical protein [Niabella sp. W65]ULT38988.1 hypothetical protein KRR40_28585 [Niabella sp. I65]
MEHKHQYNARGQQICCTQEEKVYAQAGARALIKDAPLSTGTITAMSTPMTTGMIIAAQTKLPFRCLCRHAFPSFFY